MSLQSLLNQSLVIQSRSAYNAQGREVLGATTTVLGRVQPKQKTIFSPTGELITIDAVAYLKPTTTVSIGDKITYSSESYKVYGKYSVPDGQGNVNHIKLNLIKWQI